MESRMLKILGIAAGLMLSNQALAQPQPADEWINSASEDSTAVNNHHEDVVDGHSNSMTFEGLGGPIEERTGYPPCTPDPADDNCIQLYENGVSGLGN